MSDFNLALLLKMKHSPVRNYALPGLTSWLIGNPGPNGVIRLFECERETVEHITPHSHRFDFQCWVLEGWVRNRIWRKGWTSGDWYTESAITGRMGEYTTTPGEAARYEFEDYTYAKDEWYGMTHRQVHSIYFGRDTKVLFFEGPEMVDSTTIIEPHAYGSRVPTFKTEPWMFRREENNTCTSEGTTK